ncbi:hypothetical protein [Flavobacterium sp. WG21]|uniref:hypothetical protein n=1 Tax=Flavobacterium sp. WG21 TaxID=1229487 RepID=UPI00034D03A1|nr:hypothetical protein [Flavobacterium sp. WG21]
MKNIKKMAMLLMVLGVAVLTGRCVSEEAGSEQKIEQSIKVSQARVWFEQYQSKVKIDSSFKSQVYNWDSAITETFENGSEAIVVPVTDKNLSDAYKGQKVLYLYPLKDKKGFSATLYEILPLSESLEKIKTSGDLINFNGYIIAWDLEKGFVNGAKFENSNTTAALTGLRVISSEESERLNKSTAKSDSDPFELDEVIIRREKSENKQEYGGGAYGGSLKSGSKGNSPKGYVKSPGGGGSGSSTTSENAQNIVKQIKTNLPACIDNIVNDIKKLQKGKFSQVIAKFSGVNPTPANYNWLIIKGNLSGNNAGNTNGVVSDGKVTTTLNESDLSVSTDLSIAKTLIHECFHAYLVSVYRYRDIDKSYVNLVETYFKQFNKNVNDAQHNIFADTNIVQEISVALQEYGTSKGYNLPKLFYDDMAWGGLAETKAFKNLPQADQERILDRIYSEYKNSGNNSFNPRGKKACQ